MTLAERIMDLKGKTYYSHLERLCGVKASIVSEIARGIRTEIKDDGKKDIDVGDLIAIAHKAFGMTIMELMGPIYGFNKQTVMRSKVKIEGVWHIMTLARYND